MVIMLLIMFRGAVGLRALFLRQLLNHNVIVVLRRLRSGRGVLLLLLLLLVRLHFLVFARSRGVGVDAGGTDFLLILIRTRTRGRAAIRNSVPIAVAVLARRGVSSAGLGDGRGDFFRRRSRRRARRLA